MHCSFFNNYSNNSNRSIIIKVIVIVIPPPKTATTCNKVSHEDKNLSYCGNRSRFTVKGAYRPNHWTNWP